MYTIRNLIGMSFSDKQTKGEDDATKYVPHPNERTIFNMLLFLLRKDILMTSEGVTKVLICSGRSPTSRGIYPCISWPRRCLCSRQAGGQAAGAMH